MLTFACLQEFFTILKAEGPPKLLAKSNCKKLYKGFIDSCHFWPWFKAKEQVRFAGCRSMQLLDVHLCVCVLLGMQHAVRKLHMIARAARMGMPVAALLARLGEDTLSIAGLSPRPAGPPARSLKPHSASPSAAHSHSPKREALDRRSMMSFFTQSKAARSPNASTTASPLAALTQHSDLVSVFADFHARICAAFTREERLLNKVW